MSEIPVQTRNNHVRLDASFHFFLLPALFVLLIWSAVHAFRFPSSEAIMLPAIVLLALLTAFKARVYALKVQDRIIRLEEQLRLARLLPDSLTTRIRELTEPQLIALRFASDPEVPHLVERTLDQNLSNRQIKSEIRVWRADYWRV